LFGDFKFVYTRKSNIDGRVGVCSIIGLDVPFFGFSVAHKSQKAELAEINLEREFLRVQRFAARYSILDAFGERNA